MVSTGASADPGRVIVLSSSAHLLPSALARGDVGNLQSMSYVSLEAYAQSKLANLLFAYELDRRCRDLGLPIVANAVNPGAANTDHTRHIVANLQAPQFA